MEGHPSEPPIGPAPSPAALPWEEPGRPILVALTETIQLFITRPGEAFSRLSPAASLARPVFYALIAGWVGAAASALYEILFHGAMMRFIPGMADRTEFFFNTAWQIAGIALAPVFILIGLFIWSGICHVILMMLGGAGAGFQGTLRAQSYATTSALAYLLPFLGGLIAVVWSIVLQIMGLARVHRISQGKAAVAALLPFALCCGCIVLIMMIAGAGIMAAIFKNHG